MFNRILMSNSWAAWLVGEWHTLCDFKLGRVDEWLAFAFIVDKVYDIACWFSGHSQYALWQSFEALSLVPFVLLFRYYARRKREASC